MEASADPGSKRPPAFPAYGLYGLLLLLLAWFFNWGMSGLRTHLLFFPQWLGYCLLVDAATRYRTGTSLISRGKGTYVLLFILSIPVWWFFEGLNLVTRNWEYLGRIAFSDLEFFLYSSLSFSTVIPAVFGTSELLATIPPLKETGGWRGFQLANRQIWILHGAGWILLLLLLLAPDLFFPCLWLAPFFILDSINARMGNPSLIRELSQGSWRNLVLYGLGALSCGFFWELWNFYAFPKWVYDIPYLDALHVFEMPLAGYGGYIPFGWELFAVYHFAAGLTGTSPRERPPHRGRRQ
jgi:hypothetical protein